jgi:antitoxin component YwqK of YwqJK toxin-antitoxin module
VAILKKMRDYKIIGLLILLGQFSCSDTVKSKTEYRLDRAGNPEYKEVEYQYISGKDEKGNVVEIRNGLTKEFYPNGQIKSEIDFSGGKVNGQVKTYFENGRISEISSWTNDFRNGTSKFFYDNGAIYQEESYKDGKLNGEQTTYFDNGKIKTRISYKDDFVWQVLVTNDTLGNKLDELTIDNGNGVLNTYYPNGKIQSKTDFVNGMPNGKSKFFFESGKEQGYVTMVDGQKNGELLFFHENGQIARKALFKNDIIIEKKYNQKGKIISETYFKENLTKEDIELISGGIFQAVAGAIDPLGLGKGIMNGPNKTYYDNGQLESEQYYLDGLQDSVFREYYDNGVIKTDIFFDDNFESNKRYEKRFDKTGKVIKSLTFELRGQELIDKEKELKRLLETKTKD